jgi:small-conductance mechanosensitive channel
MMLHLAQVHQQAPSEPPELKLLAAQEGENAWTVLTGEVMLPPDQAAKVRPSQLVLADLSPDNEILELQDAKDWVIEIIQQHLGDTTLPTLLKDEVERAEQWRQSLTLQSQELDRRALEMEARREQIQELEENLKQERRSLEIQREQLDQEKQAIAMSRNPIGG